MCLGFGVCIVVRRLIPQAGCGKKSDARSRYNFVLSINGVASSWPNFANLLFRLPINTFTGSSVGVLLGFEDCDTTGMLPIVVNKAVQACIGETIFCHREGTKSWLMTSAFLGSTVLKEERRGNIMGPWAPWPSTLSISQNHKFANLESSDFQIIKNRNVQMITSSSSQHPEISSCPTPLHPKII